MKNELVFFWSVFSIAVASNLYASAAQLDYMWSLVMGMGLPLLVAIIGGFKTLDRNDFKVLLAYEIIFIIPSTIIIEKVMLFFDTWGFSREHVRFIGINIFGAPIEEYLYWWIAPILVGVVYLVMRKGKETITVPPFVEKAFEVVAKAGSMAAQASTAPDRTEYIEDQAGVTKERKGLFTVAGQSKYPTWIWIQVLVVAVILWLKHHFKGSWLTVALSSSIFAVVAFLGERHAITMGFWSYNANRMLGIFFLGIPFEEYIMYFASAISACLIIEIAGRRFFNLK